MRLSRNRNWGHPELIHFLEGRGTKVAKAGTWRGLLVGDMSQPRGGPMITGHASHQVGLDADIWLTPMPPELSRNLGDENRLKAAYRGGCRALPEPPERSNTPCREIPRSFLSISLMLSKIP
jgi:hypothetical protein